MEIKFVQHLIEIGFIDNKTEKQLLSLYYEKSKMLKSNKYIFNELMTEILFLLLDNLNEIQKKFICFHLPVKFIKLSQYKLKQNLKNIIIKNNLKNKFILAKYLLRWKNNIHTNIIANIKSIFPNKILKNQKKNIHKNNNEESKISEYIKNYFLYYNNNYSNNKQKNRNKNQNQNQKNYHTLNNENNNENRSKTYNDIIKKNNLFLTKNILKSLYDKKRNNYTKVNKNKNIFNYIIDINNNKMPVSNCNKIQNSIFIKYTQENKNKNNNKNNDISLSSVLRDSNETYYNLISTNSYTKNNSASQRYNPDSYVMNSYIMKTPKNNISFIQNMKKREINEFIKKKDLYLNKKQLENFFDEDLKNNDSSSPIPKIYIKNNNYNNSIFNTNDNSNIKHINKIYMNTYSNKFNPPFCENIKRSFLKDHYSVYNRLYEEGKNRNIKLKQKKLEQEKHLDDLSNQISGYKKKVDYDRINKLYDNKERSKSFEKTKIKVENEEGLTFKPIINRSEYNKRICSNFIERNYYNNKIETENDDNYLITVTNSNLNTQNKLTKKQKEKIINRIIDKLNTNSLIKAKNVSYSCNKYTKEGNDNSKSHKKKLQ